MKRSHLTCSALFALLFSGNVNAENWPQWRGPRSDGISTEKNLPTQWSKTENVAWRTPMPGQAGATPCVWDDRIYATSADKNDLVVLCVSTTDGKVLWKQKVGTGNQDARAGEGNSASPSPCTDGKHVWVFFGTGVLACYTKDGDEVWKFDVGDRFGKLDIQFGMTSTPVLDGDHLYMQLIHGRMKMDDNTRTGKVIKLDKMTGKTVWEVERATDAAFECKHSYASPFIYDDKSSKFLVVHGADCITGHDLSTGNEEAIAWNSARTPDVSIPLIVDGLVYLLQKDGKLQCMELATGKELYLERTYSGQHRSSPTYADGHIYFGSNDGHFSVVRAGREFKLVSTMEMGEAITASAIVSNGTLYVRSYEALYAIKK